MQRLIRPVVLRAGVPYRNAGQDDQRGGQQQHGGAPNGHQIAGPSDARREMLDELPDVRTIPLTAIVQLVQGSPCDGPDGDLCKEGTLHCGASPQCSDTTGTNVELCNGVDDDCDGVVDDSCTTCGDGVCNGSDDCTNCPSDCDLEPITVNNHVCLMCDSTGEMVCEPGTFLWCCPN